MFTYGRFSYSLDKIKISGRILPPKHKLYGLQLHNIGSWIKHKGAVCQKTYEIREDSVSFSPFKYRYAYAIKLRSDSEGLCYFAEHYNGDYKDSRPIENKFIVEFNPNKSGILIFKDFLSRFNVVFDEIKSFDIAYDILGYSPNDVLLDTSADIMTYGKKGNQTLYIAPSSESIGRVKVYSKDKERKNMNVEMEKTLRIEATFKKCGLACKSILYDKSFMDFCNSVCLHLNQVKIKENTETSDDWKLYALSCLTPEQLQKCFTMMSNKTAINYRKSIEQSSYFSLDITPFTLIEHIYNILSPYMERLKIK